MADGAVLDDGREAVDERSTPERQGTALERVAVAVVALPLVVSAVDLFVDVGDDYLATSDRAGLELRAGDVGHHDPLIGPFSRDDWHHPGPFLYYLLALPLRLAGHRSIGIALGALLINGVAIIGLAVLARRRGAHRRSCAPWSQ